MAQLPEFYMWIGEPRKLKKRHVVMLVHKLYSTSVLHATGEIKLISEDEIQVELFDKAKVIGRYTYNLDSCEFQEDIQNRN